MKRFQVKIDDSILPNFYSFDELIENGLLDERDENIKIRLNAVSEWITARDFPFSDLITSDNNDNITEDMEQQTGYFSINDDGTINRRGDFNKPAKPDSNLIWSIICISVCLPFGILALIEAVKVDSLYDDGNYVAAQKASDNSKKWSMWCLWAWLIMLGIIIIASIANS